MTGAAREASGRRGAQARWQGVANRTAATQPMRDGFLAKLRSQVLDENPGLTDEGEIERRIEHKRRLHYARMQASSLRTRRANASRKRQQ